MNSLASTRRGQRLLLVLAAITAIILTAGCGSSSSKVVTNPSGFTNSSFTGTYVISMAGEDVNKSNIALFAIVGTITADGKGKITGGTVDINDLNLPSPGVYTAQPVSPSTYSITSDGRGTGTLITPAGKFGLDFVLTSSNHGLITRYDGNGSGSGTIDIQGSATQSSLASLAFSLSGVDYNANGNLGTVGAFTLNSSGAVTAGMQDINDSGSSIGGLNGLNLDTTSSLVLTNGTNGTAQLNSNFGSLAFDVWVIDSTHLKFIETDTANTGYALSGDAFTQQTSFTAGQLVYTLAGLDSSLNPLVAGGYATTDANGNLSTALEDYNDAGFTGTVSNFTGSSNATAPFTNGRAELTWSGFSNGGLAAFVFAAYPSSGGIQLLEIDGLGLMQGAAYAQTATSFSAAGYALNLTGTNGDNFGDVGEVDDIAQFNSTTAVAPAVNMTGVLDENSILGGLAPNKALSGSYTPDSPATGRGGISVTTNGTFIGGLTLAYYVVDASTVLFIEGDSNQATLGAFELQSTSQGGAGARAQSHISMVRPVFRPHATMNRR